MKKTVLLFCIVAFVLTVRAQKAVGFGGKAEIGYGYSTGNSFHTFNVNLKPGYHFNPHWFAGVGVGYQKMRISGGAFYQSHSLSLMPLFAHGQWNVTKNKRWTPFVGTKVGYAFGSGSFEVALMETSDPLYYKIQGQLLWGLEVGAKCTLGSSAVYVLLGYDCTDIKASASVGHYDVIGLPGVNETIGVKLGWEF